MGSVEIMVYKEQRDDKCYLEELDAECENIPQKKR